MPARKCPHCGQKLPPKAYVPKTYPKLSSGVVERLFTSNLKRTWLAAHYNVPLSLVSRIKFSPNLRTAIEQYGA